MNCNPLSLPGTTIDTDESVLRDAPLLFGVRSPSAPLLLQLIFIRFGPQRRWTTKTVIGLIALYFEEVIKHGTFQKGCLMIVVAETAQFYSTLNSFFTPQYIGRSNGSRFTHFCLKTLKPFLKRLHKKLGRAANYDD